MSGLLDGLTFPIKTPGYAITWVALGKSARGVGLGTISVGGTMYVVYLITDYVEGRRQ